VRVKGLEPPSSCERQDLNLLRLPVPPHPLRTYCKSVENNFTVSWDTLRLGTVQYVKQFYG
jgi:hypothetical protein